MAKKTNSGGKVVLNTKRKGKAKKAKNKHDRKTSQYRGQGR